MPSTPPRPGKRSRSRSSEKSTPPNSPSSDERPLRKGQHSEASQSPPPPQPLKAHAGGKNKKSRSQERPGKSASSSEHQHSTSPPPSPSLSSSQSSVNGSGKAHKGKAKSVMSEEDEAILMLITSIVDDWQHGSRMLSEQMIRVILRRVRPVLMSQPMLVRVEAPVNVCGDLHGQITDLVEILKAGGLPPDSRYLFLGDYVDRGKYGSEVITVLLGFKVLYPESIYLLRGNHEADNVCRIYGFFDEVKRRFSVKLFKEFTDVFNCLPISALIEDIALCMHGGLSPELRDVRQIEQVPRPLVVPDEGLACDILWSDPEEGSSGWQPSERGVSFTFGADVAKRMCDVLGIDIVLRAHQVVDNGYSFFADRRVVTIFSASNYCGEFSNSGAMMVMDETCKCSFQIFKPQYGQKLK